MEDDNNNITDLLAEQQNLLKSMPKKGEAFNNFKINKKLTQGVKVLTNIEKKSWEELVSKNPTKNLFVLHFGSGDEEDFLGVSNFAEKFGKIEIQIFPGLPYGFIEYEKIEEAEALIKATQLMNGDFSAYFAEIEFEKRTRFIFFFFTTLSLSQLNRQKDTDIPDADIKTNIPGLEVLENFVTEEEEEKMLKEIEKNQWATLAHRRVQHYGYEFIYGKNTIDKTKYIGELPDFSEGVLNRINDVSRKFNDGKIFDQMTINEYQPGAGIPPHVDTHETFEECFVALSLGSGIVMTLKNEEGEQRHVFMPARSLIVFKGEARHAWYHMIATRKIDRVKGKLFFRRKRISLTLRKVREGKCSCEWPFYCDSQTKGATPSHLQISKKGKVNGSQKDEETKEGDAEEIEVLNKEGMDETTLSEWEKKYVYKTYDKIAPHFSSTRYKAWPKIEAFLKGLEKWSIVADIGCGNGKYLGVNPDLLMLGSDRSVSFVEICKNRDSNTQVFSADGLKLPLRSETVDHTISVAVVHHFSTRQLRIQAIRELARITRKGGLILIYVWALEQEGRKFTNQDLLVPWNLQFKFEDEQKLNTLIEDRKASDTSKDEIKTVEEIGEIDEEKKTIVYKRYYHVFKQGELEEIVGEVPDVSIEESFYDHANWCVRLKKL